MKRLSIWAPTVILLLAFTINASAFTLSGTIDGAVWFGGITYVYAISVEWVYPPEMYLGIVILGNGSYSISSVPEGDYILVAFQDRDYNMLPSTGDYFGWYDGGQLPEVLTVVSNMSGLNITVAPLPANTISGSVTYTGTATGLTLFNAATDPNFQNIAAFSLLFDTTGSGDYTIFVDPGIYYVRAFIDLNFDFTLTAGEPNGYYGMPGNPVAVNVTSGSAENIDFNIYDPCSVLLSLEPIGAPIVIPPQGGSFSYTITIQNQGTGPASFDVWTEIVLPGGTVYGPLINRALTLPGSAQASRTLTQTIPGNAPSGTYFYVGKAGDYPDIVISQDSFDFVKSAFGENGSGVSGWGISGWDYEIGNALSICNLNSISPNPFNNRAEISFSLNRAAEVEAGLYDVLGRKAVDITRGYYQAGIHHLTIDGNELSTGMYFLMLEAGAEVQVEKVLLIK